MPSVRPNMREAFGFSGVDRCAARALLAAMFAFATATSAPSALADPSKLVPELGYNYGQTETPRIAAMSGALRAFSNSTDALFTNPANMAVSRVYHVGALAQIWPEASRQSYGLGIVDSIVSASHLAGGLGGTWTRQDPDGVDRTNFDVRFALAYPFSEHFFLGASGRYLSLKESGFPAGVYDLRPSVASGGLRNDPIVQSMTFDAGLTAKPVPELAFSLVGYNLTDPGNGFLPLMLGGGAAYGTTDFTVEGDVVADFTTYGKTKARAMGGGELLVANHVPLRAGYRYDQGLGTHALSFGVGYADPAYSFDLAVQRFIAGASATAIVIGFTYHVESTGISPDSDL
jgi:hypothetical protein